MSEEVDLELLNQVKEWCKNNLPFSGKLNLVGQIAKDLGLETFEYGLPHWKKTYPYNTEVAKSLNQLSLKQRLKGRSYEIYLEEN